MTLPTHEENHDLGATFIELNGSEAVAHYGDVAAEYDRLNSTAAVLDLSFRTRLVIVGSDRIQFLHSQCTNDIKRLNAGEGCYTAITNNKGRMEGDANVFVLADEVLLDAEPGQEDAMTKRFEQFVVSDDVEIVDAAPHYGLITVQGPRSADVLRALELDIELPQVRFSSVKCDIPVLGELYVVNHPRLRSVGFDIFAPTDALGVLLDKSITAANNVDGGLAGWEAFDIARVKAGIPRFGVDMTGKTLAPEAGLDANAISYNKGCYIGQEVLNRLRTFAEVNKRLCRLKLRAAQEAVSGGEELLKENKRIGALTSVTTLPSGETVALGYVSKGLLEPGIVIDLENGGEVEQQGPVE